MLHAIGRWEVKIVVGVVQHGEDADPPLESNAGLEIISRTNARPGPRGTPWLGFGANHNCLMESAAGADWYVALNPDVDVTQLEIRGLIEQAEDSGYSVVAPMFRSPWGITGAPQASVPDARHWVREAIAGSSSRSSSSSRVEPSEWVSGACMAIRIGELPIRFDERFFMYFEDVDLCCRARDAGGRIGVCGEIVVRHGSGWSSDDPLLSRRGVEFARSAMEFAKGQQQSPTLTRFAGLARFGSRLVIPGRTDAERASARAITLAFQPFVKREGLAELARRHNEQLR